MGKGRQAPCARLKYTARTLGIHLPEQVNLKRAVDGHQARDGTERGHAVGVGHVG